MHNLRILKFCTCHRFTRSSTTPGWRHSLRLSSRRYNATVHYANSFKSQDFFSLYTLFSNLRYQNFESNHNLLLRQHWSPRWRRGWTTSNSRSSRVRTAEVRIACNMSSSGTHTSLATSGGTRYSLMLFCRSVFLYRVIHLVREELDLKLWVGF